MILLYILGAILALLLLYVLFLGIYSMLNMEEKKDHDFLISVTGQVSNAAVRQ